MRKPKLKDQLNSIADVLESYQFNIVTEDELQEAVEKVLGYVWTVRREVKLSTADRIDFMIDGIGIELKIKSSYAQVIEQLHRYAQHDFIEALVLVTTKAQHDVPDMLNGKPLKLVNLAFNNSL